MVEIGEIRRSSVKARMRALAIVEFQIAADRGACLADAVVGSEIDLFVFDRAPEPFDEDVVAPGSLAVHADGDSVRQEQAGEVGAGATSWRGDRQRAGGGAGADCRVRPSGY